MSGERPPPGHGELFLGFAKMGLSGFGGVLAFARQIMVEERKWLDDREFAEMLALGQILPGPNVVNLSVFVGARFRGPTGALASVAGILLPPVCVIVLVALVYDAIGSHPLVRSAIGAVAMAAAGLIVAMGAKIVARLTWRWPLALVAAAAFAGVAVFGLKLVWIVLALAPIGVAIAWMQAE